VASRRGQSQFGPEPEFDQRGGVILYPKVAIDIRGRPVGRNEEGGRRLLTVEVTTGSLGRLERCEQA
jgi:hypothetical protein